MRTFEFTLREFVERIYIVEVEDDIDPKELWYKDVKDRGYLRYSMTVGGTITHYEQLTDEDMPGYSRP